MQSRLRRLRRGSEVPVIMLTARGDDLDIVGGLEAGADEYVVKPVEPRVLDARIRAVLRRMARAGSPAETHGELVIDRNALIVRGGPPVTVMAGMQADGQCGQHLAVAVRDRGPGLPPDAIPHVFDRFYKADTARARSEGSGLGLAIAWENARLHGGHIDAGNHPDGGAMFTVNLPVTIGSRFSAGPA